jgi:hypothetical protein
MVVFPGIMLLLRAMEKREAGDLRSRFLPMETTIRNCARSAWSCPHTHGPAARARRGRAADRCVRRGDRGDLPTNIGKLPNRSSSFPRLRGFEKS